MWVKIRNLLVPIILNENTLRSLAGLAGLGEEPAKNVANAVMNVKYYVDTRDKRYINLAIDELQNLIK